MLVSQPNKIFTPKEAYNEGYFTDIAANKQELMHMCINEANRIHPDSMDAYLSVKNYLWDTNMKQEWLSERGKCLDEFARCRNTDGAQRRLDAMLARLSSSKKSKL